MRKNVKEKIGKLASLCVLSMVFFMMASSVPSFMFIAPAEAAFSSITVTHVTPTELHPGDTCKVTVTVKNNGGMDAKDIKLAFQGTETVSLIGPTVVHINTLNSWCSKEVEITVHVKEEALNGVYSIPIACSWRGHYFDPKKGTVTTDIITAQLGISFNIKGRVVINIGDITTDPADIRPGDENIEIRAFIENSGEAAAKDIEAVLICDGNSNNASFKPSWSGTDRSYIGRLNSGEKAEAIFHIDVAENAESNTYSIPLRIRYKDTNGKEYEVMRSVEILVEPKPEFEIISYYTEPAKIRAGDKGVKLHVKVRNVGSEKAESVSVRITGEADVPFDYDVKSDYLGNLKIGEDSVGILKFDVDKDALPKTYPQGIEIRCTGDRDLGDDNVYVFDKQIQLEVTSSGSSSSGRFSVPIPGFEAGLTLLLLFVVLVLRRKRFF
ncbi:MAG: COG1361 S-layer family protein [Methanophagales archaeon]|nr:COG1361 S-layer family protein [Methanophagales archaeon]MCW7069969.1 COG1361 S-layer family protein [Methanophagales archaeon]